MAFVLIVSSVKLKANTYIYHTNRIFGIGWNSFPVTSDIYNINILKIGHPRYVNRMHFYSHAECIEFHFWSKRNGRRNFLCVHILMYNIIQHSVQTTLSQRRGWSPHRLPPYSNTRLHPNNTSHSWMILALSSLPCYDRNKVQGEIKNTEQSYDDAAGIRARRDPEKSLIQRNVKSENHFSSSYC